ncbi:elicitor-responsive protein 1 isoform X1 [Vigna unguiculata]|uniref:Toll-interacting protein n=1 Tax=Vigna unguiculata TaxID=3917 RepID=A0A4D6MJS1_VIGUN|nr:elicitor-responsive protein 1 isoform X1 [Vigna unguiculata]QCE01228.1 toll-interacting protein [Vigna unguiculata]
MAFGFMEVELVKAKGLHDTDVFARMDPYVLLQYKGQERKSRVIHEGGRNPVWNEKFVFRVEYPGSGDQYKLNLVIMDKDVFSADDFVGQAAVHVKDLLAEGTEKGSAVLRPHKYSVVRADQSYCGEIEVGITFTLKEQEYADDDEDVGGWKQSFF